MTLVHYLLPQPHLLGLSLHPLFFLADFLLGVLSFPALPAAPRLTSPSGKASFLGLLLFVIQAVLA